MQFNLFLDQILQADTLFLALQVVEIRSIIKLINNCLQVTSTEKDIELRTHLCRLNTIEDMLLCLIDERNQTELAANAA